MCLRALCGDRYWIASPRPLVFICLAPFPLLMSASASALYAARAAAGTIESDAEQEAMIARLTRLEAELAERRPARKSSAMGWLFGLAARERKPIRGLYIFGDVGRGKTMLMDLFFETAPGARKRRVHFHEFMVEVHERIYAQRQELKSLSRGEDPIVLTAAAIAQETRLLCFDEFHVTDIADAMILGRLFKRLFELGVVVVATSNVAPWELYKEGLNRELFLTFIARLSRNTWRSPSLTRVPISGWRNLPGRRSGTSPPIERRRSRSTTPGDA